MVPTTAKTGSTPLKVKIIYYFFSSSAKLFFWEKRASLERDTGALWTLEFINLFKTNLLNLESVLLERNLYNLMASL
jgi:hypothetical protein